eukprot:3889706-Prymnesium_polylepis.1
MQPRAMARRQREWSLAWSGRARAETRPPPCRSPAASPPPPLPRSSRRRQRATQHAPRAPHR